MQATRLVTTDRWTKACQADSDSRRCVAVEVRSREIAAPLVDTLDRVDPLLPLSAVRIGRAGHGRTARDCSVALGDVVLDGRSDALQKTR